MSSVMVCKVSDYQEAGQLLDAVLAGHRIEITPEDPVKEILLVFSGYRGREQVVENWHHRAAPPASDEIDLYIEEVIDHIEHWLDYAIIAAKEDRG